MFFDTHHERPFLDVKFDFVGILMKLDVLYPGLGFRQYEERLKDLAIAYLQTATNLSTHFYLLCRVGMKGQAAWLFKQFITTEYKKALLAHERRRMRVRRIANDIREALHGVP